jgi:hypothetical protein
MLNPENVAAINYSSANIIFFILFSQHRIVRT